jgi:hypothetical protein
LTCELHFDASPSNGRAATRGDGVGSTPDSNIWEKSVCKNSRLPLLKEAMRRLFCMGFLVTGLLAGLTAAEAPLPEAAPVPDVHLLVGTWRYDAAQSTELSAWGTLKLIIAVDGPRVILTRQYAAGRRSFDEVTTIDLTRSVNVISIDWWPDNRHIGAYVGGDKTKKLKFRVLSDGRLLRTSSDLVLSTQQGDRAVNILSDYKVSANGDRLTLIELRSTRNDPIVYIFKRVTDPAADAAASKGNAE